MQFKAFSGVDVGQRPCTVRWRSRFVPLKVVSIGSSPTPRWGPSPLIGALQSLRILNVLPSICMPPQIASRLPPAAA